MWFNRKLETAEYRSLNVAITDVERRLVKMQADVERLEAAHKSLQGKFYQHMQTEEEPESKDSKGFTPKYL